jgi:hypothetical protein
LSPNLYLSPEPITPPQQALQQQWPQNNANIGAKKQNNSAMTKVMKFEIIFLNF